MTTKLSTIGKWIGAAIAALLLVGTGALIIALRRKK